MAVLETAAFLQAGYTDDASIGSKTAEAASAPASNLLSDRRGEFYRTSAAVTSFFVTIDLGALKDVSAVGIIDIIGPSTIATSCQIRGADTEATTVSAPEFDSTLVVVPRLVNNKRQMSFYDGTTYNVRWVRVDVSFSGSAEVMGAGRIMIDDAYVPANYVGEDSQVPTPGSATAVTETEAGGVFLRHLHGRSTAEPSLMFSRAEYDDDLWDLLAFTGTNRPLLYIHDAHLSYSANATRVSKGILYARLEEQNGVRSEFADG